MGKQIEEDQIGRGIRSETETEEATETEEKRENGKKTKITTGKEIEIEEKTGIEREKGEKEMKIGIRKDRGKKNEIMTRIRKERKEEKKRQVKEAEMQKGLKKDILWMLKDQKKGTEVEMDRKKRNGKIKIVIETGEEKEKMRKLKARIDVMKE